MAVYNMLLLVSLLWGLVSVVHSQTVPYVSFMGVNLTNHSYVDLTLVGEDRSDHGNIVRCHSDLETCCRGIHRGDWYYPDGSVVYIDSFNDIYRRLNAQTVNLLSRNNAIPPSGIYRCQIPTEAVNDDVDTKLGEWVFVGLYPPSEGNITRGGGGGGGGLL